MGLLIVTEARTGSINCDRCGSDTVPIQFAKSADTLLMVKGMATALFWLAAVIFVIVSLVVT